MSFPSTTLSNVAEEIRSREHKLGGIELLEFDDDEYEALLRHGRRIVRRDRSDRERRTVFLALAVAHARRYNLEKEEAFWDKFEAALDLKTQENRLFITNHLLWPAYKDHGIRRVRTEQTKRYVGTLLQVAMQDSRLRREQFLDFFEWYYLRDPEQEIDDDLIQVYEEERDKNLNFYEASLNALQHHCEMLRDVVDIAVDHGLFLDDQDSIDAYFEQVQEKLGDRYDLSRYHLLRDPKALQDVITRVENHRTPRQFKQVLRSTPFRFIKSPGSASKQPLTGFDANNIPYGIYRLQESNRLQANSEEYRVVPQSWIRLKSIEGWPEKQICELRHARYIGYRSDEEFTIRSGTRRLESHPCYLEDGTHCHVWAGKVQPGRRLIVDGTTVAASTGLSASIDLSIGQVRTEDGASSRCLRLILPHVDIFRPDHAGDPLTIRHQDEEYTFTLDQDGSRTLRRAISFVADANQEENNVQFVLNGEPVDTKPQTLPASLLFSAISRERIPEGTERRWGDRAYYLLDRSDTEPEIGEGIEIERLDEDIGGYRLYRIEWTDGEKTFSVQSGDRSWTFDQQLYFGIHIQPNAAHNQEVGIERFATQLEQMTEATYGIRTNHELKGNVRLVATLNGDLLLENPLHRPDQISPDTIRSIDEARDGRTGTVYLHVFAEETLLARERVDILPACRLASTDPMHQMHRVGTPFSVVLTCEETALLDPGTGSATDRLAVSCMPAVESYPAPDHRGILLRRAADVHRPVYLRHSLGDEHASNEKIHLRFRPNVFGAWLYEGSGDEYHERTHFNYYRLDASALVVLTMGNQRVELCASDADGGRILRTWESDERGTLIVEDLAFLGSTCTGDTTTLTIRSAGCTEPISIRWAPRLHRARLVGDTLAVRLTTPSASTLIVKEYDGDENLLREHQQPASGDREGHSVALQTPGSTRRIHILVRTEDGSDHPLKVLPVTPTTSSPFTRTDFEQGVGVSDPSVLDYLS